MGVSIHYRGRLNDVGQLNRLCEELADIADVVGWESTRLDDDWEQPVDARLHGSPTGARIDGNLGLKGILIRPGEGAESPSFCFDQKGDLWSPVSRALVLEGTLKPEDAWVSVKTQFASPEIHVWIIGLLKYLKKQYISNLEVFDEGKYWETGDIRILKKKMDFLNEKIEHISCGLSSSRFGDVAGLSAEEIAARIEQFLLENEGKNAE